jgi:N-acetylmuramoyl-L-alanine amidase
MGNATRDAFDRAGEAVGGLLGNVADAGRDAVDFLGTIAHWPSSNYNSRGGTDIDTIVIHHTACDAAKALSWLRSRVSGVSAHYLLKRDGTLIRLVDDDQRAWHAGKSQLHGTAGDVNARSIGIEIVNDGDGQMPFTPQQYEVLTALVRKLRRQYQVPIENVVRHRDIAVPHGRKTDPADNFDWRGFIAEVKDVPVDPPVRPLVIAPWL